MITIVIGAQYGGEGKGKITSFLARIEEYDYVCRCGGVNSSHTVHYHGATFKLRSMPASSVVDKNPYIIFGAGTLLHIPTLLSEIQLVGYDRKKIIVDPLAGVVTEDCIEAQRSDKRYERIGSTLTGTGYATAQRAMRRLKLARDYDELRSFIGDTRKILFEAAKKKQNVLIEGHQGTGLSNYHGDYPYTSSRDSIAAAMLSELGLGLKWEYRVILVVKCFPTRNHDGNLPGELSEKDTKMLGINEFGGGSWETEDRRRRVGTYDSVDVRKAVEVNTPDYIALTGFDYWDKSTKGVRELRLFSEEAKQDARKFENEMGVPIAVISTGPDTMDTVIARPIFKRREIQKISEERGFNTRQEVKLALYARYAVPLYEMVESRGESSDDNWSMVLSFYALRECLGVPEGKHTQFADFNRRILSPAVQEVSALSGYCVTMRSIKTGRKITAVQLSCRRKGDDELLDTRMELQRPRFGRKARISDAVEGISWRSS